MSLVDTRRHQMFPQLDCAQVGTARRFASDAPLRFAPGEMLFDIGEHHAPVWLVLEGAIAVVRRDGLGREKPIVVHHAGQFTREVSQLAGRASLAAARVRPEARPAPTRASRTTSAFPPASPAWRWRGAPTTRR